MNIATLLVLHALFASDRLTLSPIVHQTAVLALQRDVTAGGVGGGAGVQLTWDHWMLAQLDVGAMFLLGNPILTRLAVGAHTQLNAYAPAAWLSFGSLWGDRIEVLRADGSRPAIPTWSLGLRASPLRFDTSVATASFLESTLSTNFRSGVWLELTLVQVGARLLP